MKRILIGVAMCAVLGGCEAHGGAGSRGSSFPFEAVTAVAAATAAEVINAATAPDPDPDPSPVYPTPPPVPAPPGFAPAPSVAFDPVPVLDAIDALDLSPCTRDGALIGWGRARITFDAGGAVSAVVIESPAGLPLSAVECLRSALSSVPSAPFEGPAVTIGANYFVR